MAEVLDRSQAAVVRVNTDKGQGSGFIIEAGVVVTADHVVRQASSIEVELLDGRTFGASLLGRHLAGDIAVLSIPNEEMPTLPLGDSADLSRGAFVIKLGYPAGLTGEPTATTGIVSRLEIQERHGVELIQTDAALNPGDSGGPLMNSLGEVIGVNSSKLVGIDVEGIGWASGIGHLTDHITDLIDGEIVCPTNPPIIEGSTFRDLTYGYKVTVPEPAPYQHVEFEGYVLFGSGTGSGGIFIYESFAIGSYPTLDDFLGVWIDFFEGSQSTQTFEVLSIQPVCLPPFGEALEVDIKSRRNLINFRERWLAVFAGGAGYLLQGLAREEAWDIQEPWIDSLIYSFRFDR